MRLAEPTAASGIHPFGMFRLAFPRVLVGKKKDMNLAAGCFLKNAPNFGVLTKR
ncbi:hypothetical protein GMI69_10270 [Eggerthellaceae bacterium zg-887]|uniref:hypothetical protein n=1 Tax=Xiamenia xianingshaonis TaxID=2682776 RepID=UPI00140B0B31|nr:hypothetical protein [Xiamenia xianingshaonis]NHM17018.1 hypothetical protein [Xiamenia xianingshaonis]